MRELQRLCNLEKQKLFKRVVIWRVVLFLLFPIFLGITIIRPNFQSDKVPIPGDFNTSDTVEIKVTDEFSPRDELSEALFGKPFRLKWEEYCLINNNDVSINGQRVKLPFEADPEAGAMEIIIDYGSYKSKIYAPAGQRRCFPIKRISKRITATFRRPSASTFDSIFKSLQVSPNGGILELSKSTHVQTENSYISIRRQYWGEVLFKFVAIILGWMVIMVNLKDYFKFFVRK